MWPYLLLISFLTLSSASRLFIKDQYGMLRPPRRTNLKLEVSDEWFTQKLDHFVPTNKMDFKQLYYSSKDYYQNGGPVFLFISGESAAEKLWMQSGAWIDYARIYNALCFQLEHRYYGRSQPTSDMSVENLKYLSSEQALADIAYFIVGMNKKYNLTTGTKWIVFGGSYAGNLAAWVRVKYPHLVHGAVSSSGPVLAKLDFKEYYEVVAESLKLGGQNCVSAVKTAIMQTKNMMKRSDGRKKLTKKFKLCETLKKSKKEDVENFMELLAGNVAEVVQYNNFASITPMHNINLFCDLMTNKSIGSGVDRFAEFTRLSMLNQDKCIDYKYNDSVKDLKNTTWSESSMERQWVYQTCTEFGFYQTSSSKQELFGASFNLDLFIKTCKDVYGNSFDKSEVKDAVERSNDIYGGKNIEVSRVVYVHGSVDPWHALGITKSNSTTAPAIFINGTSHCADMYAASDSDSSELKQVKQQISSLIGQWLKE